MNPLNSKRLKALSEALWHTVKMVADETRNRGSEKVEKGFLREEHDHCQLCGKALTTEAHRRLGIGPDCINKNRLTIGILTNRWMDFLTGNEIGTARPIQGDPKMDFETHRELISDEVGSEMRNFLAGLEQDHHLDGILVRPAEDYNEGDIWRCWMLFRNPESPYEWRDALSSGEAEADWRSRHLIDPIWQSHNYEVLDGFGAASLASMEDRSQRTNLEPDNRFWAEHFVQEERDRQVNNWHYLEDDLEMAEDQLGIPVDTDPNFRNLALTLYAHLKFACGCEPAERVCEWCKDEQILVHARVQCITALDTGVFHNKWTGDSNMLKEKPDYDELGQLLRDLNEDEIEEKYGFNPAWPDNLRNKSTRWFMNRTAGIGAPRAAPASHD